MVRRPSAKSNQSCIVPEQAYPRLCTDYTAAFRRTTSFQTGETPTDSNRSPWYSDWPQQSARSSEFCFLWT